MTSTPTADDDSNAGRTAIGVLGALAVILMGFVFPIVWIFFDGNSQLDLAPLFAAGAVIALAPTMAFTTLSGGLFSSRTKGLRGAPIALTVYGVLQAAAIATVIVFGVVTRVASWLPITMVTVGIVFSAIALFVGPRLRPPWPITADLVRIPWAAVPTRRRFVFVILIIAVPLVAGGVALLAYHPWALGPHLRVGYVEVDAWVIPIQFAAYAAAIVVGIWSMSLWSRVPINFGRDLAFRRTLARSVFKSDRLPTDPGELELARRWAAIAFGSGLALVSAYGLLCIGLGAQEVGQIVVIAREHDNPPDIIPLNASVIVVIVVTFAILTPILLRRHALARAFLAAHGEPAVTAPAGAPATAVLKGEQVVQPNG